MKIQYKHLTSILLLLLGYLSSTAQDEVTTQKILISKNDNTEISLLLSENPQITFPGLTLGKDIMKVTTDYNKFEIPTCELNKISITTINITRIEELLKEEIGISYHRKDDVILIDVNSGTSNITIYTNNGRKILSETLEKGQHSITLSSLEKGIYLIKTDREIIKIFKR